MIDAGSREKLWALLAFSMLLAVSAALGLVYLLWAYVPHHAGQWKELGASLPLSTRLVVASANWFVRLLPFLVLLTLPPLALLVTALAQGVRDGATQVIKGVAWIALIVGFVEICACAFVIHGVRAGYAEVAVDR